MSSPSKCSILGWLYSDGVVLRSRGVEATLVDGKVMWEGKAYRPGSYYLVRLGDGKTTLLTEEFLRAKCEDELVRAFQDGVVALTNDDIALMEKLRANQSRIHEAVLTEKEREVARRLAPTPYIWYYNGWLQLTKEGFDVLEIEDRRPPVPADGVIDSIIAEKLVLRDYVKKKGKRPLKDLVVLHGDKFITDMVREGLIGVKYEDGELYAFVEEEDEEEEEEDYDEDDQEFINERWMYYMVKVRGMMRLDELLRMFRGIGGDKLFESLKEKGLLTVETVDGVEYVKAK